MRLAVLAAVLISAASPAAISAQSVSLSIPPAVPAAVFADARSEQVLAAQVLLDRSRFSPGVIDGYIGENTRRAIRAFQRANGINVTGNVTTELLSKLRESQSGSIFQTYTIGQDDVNGPFVDVPSSFVEMAKLDNLAYETPEELLAEKFHMDNDFLRALNPNADFGAAGTKIVVVAPGTQKLDGKVARIEVDKASESVRAYSAEGRLLARYPATIGSDTFPSPSGSMKVLAVAPNAKYYFDPENRSWGPDQRLTIAAGPNNPIGEVWIDLSKEGYGIHGSPDPSLIGKTASHGCVRLTNWDAEELAASVGEGTVVEFV